MIEEKKLRRCKGYYMVKRTNGSKYYELVNFKLGYFHAFGIDYDEFDTGIALFSTAIIELPNGKIISTGVDNIEFIDKIEN